MGKTVAYMLQGGAEDEAMLPTMSAVVAIDSITIRQDSEGRYCLNDLHKAAGDERRHDTREFLSRVSTLELIIEIENLTEKAVNKKPGRYGGTYVTKELIYAYAMWISPAFHLKVIRAYDRLATQGVAVVRARVC